MKSMRPFHLAFPVNDLTSTRSFYKSVLGATEGRSSDSWVDFNLFGHQIVAHIDNESRNQNFSNNFVDGDKVPVPHFGVVLSVVEWKQLADRISREGWKFEIPPKLRFKGTSGEQWSMFLKDPSGNALEFKSFENPDMLFAS